MKRKSVRTSARWPTCVAAGPFLFFSGQTSDRTDFATDGHAWVERMEAPLRAQAVAIYERYRERLARAGGDLAHLLRYHIYQRDKRFFPVFDRVRRGYEKAPPASTAVGVGRFESADCARLCIDAIALSPAAARTLGPRSVLGGAVEHIAAAHFSHVIGAGAYRVIAGQIPIDASRPGAPLIRGYDDVPPAGRFLQVGRSHEDARNGPIAAQTWFTYDLIRKHLEGTGSGLSQVLNLVVYLQDMRDFPTFHRVHERFFGAAPPALTVVEVGEVGHKGTLIEIEPTAIAAQGGLKRTAFNTAGARAPAHMSEIVEAGGLAFLSGIVGVDYAGEPVTPRKRAGARDVAAQAAGIVRQLGARLKAAGHDADAVAHVTVYVQDIDCFVAAERVLAKWFGARRPALTVLEVPHPAPLAGAAISVTAIAWFGAGKPAAA